MMFKRSKTTVSMLVLMLFMGAYFTVPAHGQLTGATLSGTVADAAGANVPNAKVSVQNQGTGDNREVTSNNDGFYSAPNLPSGEYTVTATAAGFSGRYCAGT